jgi:hypothetical protein
VDGILGFHGAFFTTCYSFHNGILAIRNSFTRTFPFSRWNFGYQEAFFTNFFLFHDRILAIRKPFSRTFFIFHDGILAIRKLFSRTFFFFTMEFWLSGSLFHALFSFSRRNSDYQEAFFTNFFLSHDGILAIRKSFSRTFFFFTIGFLRCTIGGKLFSYIYDKEYLHRICLVKNLAS